MAGSCAAAVQPAVGTPSVADTHGNVVLRPRRLDCHDGNHRDAFDPDRNRKLATQHYGHMHVLDDGVAAHRSQRSLLSAGQCLPQCSQHEMRCLVRARLLAILRELQVRAERGEPRSPPRARANAWVKLEEQEDPIVLSTLATFICVLPSKVLRVNSRTRIGIHDSLHDSQAFDVAGNDTVHDHNATVLAVFASRQGFRV